MAARSSTPSAFDVHGPSVFAGDSRFAANRSGLSKSQRASMTVQQRKAETGWSPGLIWGLSAKADKQVHAPKKRG